MSTRLRLIREKFAQASVAKFGERFFESAERCNEPLIATGNRQNSFSEFVQLPGLLLDRIELHDLNAQLVPTSHHRDANSNMERSRPSYLAYRLCRDLQ